MPSVCFLSHCPCGSLSSPQICAAVLIAFHTYSGSRTCFLAFLPKNRHFVSLFQHANKKCHEICCLLDKSCTTCNTCHLWVYTGIVVSEVTINAAGIHQTWHSFSPMEMKKLRGHSWHLIKEALCSKSTCSNLFLTANMVTWEKIPAGPTEHSLRTWDNLCRLEIQNYAVWSAQPDNPGCQNVVQQNLDIINSDTTNYRL